MCGKVRDSSRYTRYTFSNHPSLYPSFPNKPKPSSISHLLISVIFYTTSVYVRKHTLERSRNHRSFSIVLEFPSKGIRSHNALLTRLRSLGKTIIHIEEHFLASRDGIGKKDEWYRGGKGRVGRKGERDGV